MQVGSIRREWEPGRPQEGAVRVGFVLIPAQDTSRPPLGTLVPHEGGPGYSTTGSVDSFRRMYGPLLERRQVLLVDQRGTGRSDDYATALSADDTAAVAEALDLGPLDLYGDSYGTFFQQVFAGRHPDLVRSIVLDGAYPAYGETGWYPTQRAAMRNAFTVVCERSPACRDAGASRSVTIRRVLDRVRERPWRGTAYDADGTRARVTVNARSAMPVFPRSVSDLGRKRTIDATVADVMDRWWNSYSGLGVGLRGGSFRYTGSAVVRFRLDKVRLVEDLAVSGRVVWDRYVEKVTLHVTAHDRRHSGRSTLGLTPQRRRAL